jgi:hypothetical protein
MPTWPANAIFWRKETSDTETFGIKIALISVTVDRGGG